jgi:hypothetical protein
MVRPVGWPGLATPRAIPPRTVFRMSEWPRPQPIIRYGAGKSCGKSRCVDFLRQLDPSGFYGTYLSSSRSGNLGQEALMKPNLCGLTRVGFNANRRRIAFRVWAASKTRSRLVRSPVRLRPFSMFSPHARSGERICYFWRVCLPSVTKVQGSEPRAISYV